MLGVTSLLLLSSLPRAIVPAPSGPSCIFSETTLNCSGSGLTTIDDILTDPSFSSAQTIDLSNNRLRDSSIEVWNSFRSRFPHLSNLDLSSNIITTIPVNFLPASVKLNMRNNPLHCSCDTLLIPSSNLLFYTSLVCATTTNPELRNNYIRLAALASQPERLNCVKNELVVPVEITLYKTLNARQTIPCEQGGGDGQTEVRWYRVLPERKKLVYRTTRSDCSLQLRYVDETSSPMLYEVQRTGLYQNKTERVRVFITSDGSGPVINDSLTLMEVQKRAAAKVTCQATGSPTPAYTWSYLNRTVKESTDKLVVVDPQTVIVTEVTSEMILTCTATNVLGSNSVRFLVKPVELTEQQELVSRLFPVFICLFFLSTSACVCYFVYSKHRIARLKGRSASPATSITASDTVFENTEAGSSGSLSQLGDSYKILAISLASPPNQFICPITRECMKNPVVASDGFSYEEKAIQAWFRRNETSPMTNGDISKRLTQNHNLRTMIQEVMSSKTVSDSFMRVGSNSSRTTPDVSSSCSRCQTPRSVVSTTPRGSTENITLEVSRNSSEVPPNSSEVSQRSGSGEVHRNPAAEVSNVSIGPDGRLTSSSSETAAEPSESASTGQRSAVTEEEAEMVV